MSYKNADPRSEKILSKRGGVRARVDSLRWTRALILQGVRGTPESDV